MSETSAPKTVKAAAAKTAKAFEAPFEAFNVTIPNVEIPAAFREFAEKSVNSSKEAYAKFKTAAEEATEVFEDSYETTRASTLEFGHKSLDAAKTNVDAAFTLARDLLSAKTFAEVIELQTAFARKQAETLAAQVKDFQALSQKLTTDASRPVKEGVEKAMKAFKLN
ncbi:phasin [Kaistia dalseonensis]|uniref:Phasin n=1 Tax=Kaistia dalseonensis TaxID=410840 RepID=A0ABU0H715_9HYPH|nr:phasin [Kaistia dalseonensis]MCX5495500.1 phasin [Kaistia dalseonensis]MDQ0438092.1 phasin [Kaistia dalseonensis]